jgi:nucleotide-binding universal stress UspA family protein
MYERIVVALDGSELAEIAIPYAEEMALRLGSELDIVTVCESTGEMETMRRVYIERVAAELGRIGLRVHPVVLYDKAADAILEYCDLNKINMIVLSTHGRSGIGRWVLGSVAGKIVRGASCPVLLITANKNDEPKLESVAVKRILLPLDGSPLGESTLTYVEELATKMHCEVLLLQIIKPLDKDVFVSGYTVLLADIYGDIRNQAEIYLSKVEQRLKENGITTQYEVIFGLPASAIIDYARDKAVNLVAMSTHGRGGISRWVMGSVADKVLHVSRLPLLLVKSFQVIEARA